MSRLSLEELEMLKRIDDSFDTGPEDLWSSRVHLEHELKTPLTAIRAAAEILHDYADLTPDERRQFTDVVLSESARLSTRVSELVEHAVE